LLGEQTLISPFGPVGGKLLRLFLATATMPSLTWSDTAVDQVVVDVPGYVLGYVLVATWPVSGVPYGTVVVTFVLALLISARYAATIGLGTSLRLGED
jgi:hypothetical protein